MDLEDSFQLGRFRHMRTVLRIIGTKTGTGGSRGVGFLLTAALDDQASARPSAQHCVPPAAMAAKCRSPVLPSEHDDVAGSFRR